MARQVSHRAFGMVATLFRLGLAAAFIAGILVACGQKGPLYLPPPEEEPERQH